MNGLAATLRQAQGEQFFSEEKNVYTNMA